MSKASKAVFLKNRLTKSVENSIEEISPSVTFERSRNNVWLRSAFWNGSNNTCCFRTPRNWCNLLIFYSMFLGGLFSFFLLLLKLGFFLLLHKNKPTIMKNNGNPGLSFKPISKYSSPLILYGLHKNATSDPEYVHYTNDIGKFLDNYLMENSYRANFSFNISDLGPCAVEPYGYDTRTPCIYLKLNKIVNWTPHCYKNRFPELMPLELQETIDEKHKSVTNLDMFVWVSCDGLSPADQEHLGPVTYYPLPGFSARFFPYLGDQRAYQSPLVAVRFLNMTFGILVTVECRAWAENINGHQKGQNARFQILIDR